MNPLINEAWADKRVRQAILFAIDREEILRAVYGIADPKTLSCLYVDPSLIPDDVATYPYDPETRKALLAEAGVDPDHVGRDCLRHVLRGPGVARRDDGDSGEPGRHRGHGEHPAIGQRHLVKRYYEDGMSEFSMIGGDGGLPNAGYGRRQPPHRQRMAEGRQRLQGLELQQPRDRPALRPALVAVRRRRATGDPARDLPDPRRRAAVRPALGHDPLLVHQQPDRELREHARAGRRELLLGAGDVVRARITSGQHHRGGAESPRPDFSCSSGEVMRPLRLLCIGGHPADAFDSAGGTLAHHVERGDHVSVMALTAGTRIHDVVISDTLRAPRPDAGAAELADADGRARAGEGGRGPTGLRLPRDQRRPLLPLRRLAMTITAELIDRMARFLRENRPDVVITHHPHELGAFGVHHASRLGSCSRALPPPAPSAPTTRIPRTGSRRSSSR